MDMTKILERHHCTAWKDTDYLGAVFRECKKSPAPSGVVPALHIGIHKNRHKMIVVYPVDSYTILKNIYTPVLDFFNLINDSGGMAFLADKEEDVAWHFLLELKREKIWEKSRRDLLEIRFLSRITEWLNRKFLTVDETELYKELLADTFRHKEYAIWDAFYAMEHICFFHRGDLSGDFCLACAYEKYLEFHREIIASLFNGLKGRK